MSGNVLHIEMPPYLVQWFIHENGGGMPVSLARNSTAYRCLKSNITVRPSNIPEPELPDSYVTIAIPEFKGMDDELNFLPRAKREELGEYIRNDFIFDFMCYMRRPAHYRKRKDRLIEAWMETHGIEFNDTNWNALAKIYQRQMGNDRVARHRQRKRSKKRRVNKC